MEVLVVIAIIAIIAALLLPVLHKAQMKSREASCLSQLKQIGLVLHAFAHEHESRFPSQVPASQGGTREYYYDGEHVWDDFYVAATHWQVLSNDLVTPKLVRCPSDTRQAVERFADLNNEHLSYFLGLKAQYGDSDSILAGDRNLDPQQGSGPEAFGWTRELHEWKGNLLFADGRAETATSAELRVAMANNKVIGPLPTPSSPVTTVLPPNTASSASGSTVNWAAQAQDQLQSFFNGPRSPSDASKSAPASGITNDPFVYIAKDNPSRLVAANDPMKVVSKPGTSSSTPSSNVVANRAEPSTPVLATNDLPSKPAAMLADAKRSTGPRWAWLFLGLAVLAVLWFWRKRPPRSVNVVEE